MDHRRKIDHVMSMANDYREGVRGYECKSLLTHRALLLCQKLS